MQYSYILYSYVFSVPHLHSLKSESTKPSLQNEIIIANYTSSISVALVGAHTDNTHSTLSHIDTNMGTHNTQSD